MVKRSKFFPREIGLSDLTEFRAGWNHTYPSSTTRSKVQERLTGFLRYCAAANLISKLPVLSPIKITAPPTMPLKDEQYANCLRLFLTSSGILQRSVYTRWLDSCATVG
jgi:integrase/recombinase XerD